MGEEGRSSGRGVGAGGPAGGSRGGWGALGGGSSVEPGEGSTKKGKCQLPGQSDQMDLMMEIRWGQATCQPPLGVHTPAALAPHLQPDTLASATCRVLITRGSPDGMGFCICSFIPSANTS